MNDVYDKTDKMATMANLRALATERKANTMASPAIPTAFLSAYKANTMASPAIPTAFLSAYSDRRKPYQTALAARCTAKAMKVTNTKAKHPSLLNNAYSHILSRTLF